MSTNNAISQIETKIDELVDRMNKLRFENNALKEEREQWEHERARLTEKNRYARERIEAMIAHLKTLEKDN